MGDLQNSQTANAGPSSEPVVRCDVCNTDVPALSAREIRHVVDSGNNRMVWICFDCDSWIKNFNSNI